MNDPLCTCKPTLRRIPHNAACPRYDDDRAWSITDRLVRSWQDAQVRLEIEVRDRPVR